LKPSKSDKTRSLCTRARTISEERDIEHDASFVQHAEYDIDMQCLEDRCRKIEEFLRKKYGEEWDIFEVMKNE